MENFYLVGSVVDQHTGGKVSRVKVEAWDKDPFLSDLVGCAVTDEQGNFSIEFDSSYFQELLFDRKPDIYFKVFYKNKLIKSTESSILWNLEAGKTIVRIDVAVYSREDVYQKFLALAVDGVEDKPVLLYQGIKNSPYENQIKDYPQRLTQVPDGKNIVSGTKVNSTFIPYPTLGELPVIDENGLNFLSEEIKEACICIGAFVDGQLQTKWLGRNALSNQQFWSGTKIIPILNVVSRVNLNSPTTVVENCNIKGNSEQGIPKDCQVYDLIRDVVSYEEKIGTSNSIAAMFKRFAPQVELENWLKAITGNKNLIFRGRYGEKPLIDQPKLFDRITGQLMLAPDPLTPLWESNTISAYDLTRMVSMLGWHNYIPEKSRLPGANWQSLETVIRAMGCDPARLFDLGIKELGLQSLLDSTVIISKLGNGASDARNRTEAVYIALVQFVTGNLSSDSQPPALYTLAMALRSAKVMEPRDLNREVVEVDASMATEVTEILRRLLINEII